MGQTKAAGTHHDRECQAHTTCMATEWQTKAAGTHHDRVCQAHTTCSSTQWETRAAGTQHDRLCANHRICTAGEWQTRAAGTQHDRVCQICPAGHSCDGLYKVPCSADTYQGGTGQTKCEPCGQLDAKRRFSTQGKTGQTECTPVPLDCVPDQWGAWNTCSRSCGTGTQKRARAATAVRITRSGAMRPSMGRRKVMCCVCLER